MKRRIVIGALIVSGLYLASYLAISAAGSYRIVAWGLSGPKGPRIWMPFAFYNRYNECNAFVGYFYAPLFLLDRSIWHEDTDSPPLPPPFVQGDLTIVPPVFCHRPFRRETEGTITHISIPFTDATGRRFTMHRIRSTSGRIIPRSPICVSPDGNASNSIVVVNQTVFTARILDEMKEEPEQKR